MGESSKLVETLCPQAVNTAEFVREPDKCTQFLSLSPKNLSMLEAYLPPCSVLQRSLRLAAVLV